MYHARWILLAVLLSALLFSLYTYTEATRGTAMSREAVLGKIIFQNKNCIACHQLYGLGGFMGPDLTYVCLEPGKGKEYARTFIKNGTARMPDFNLTEKEVGYLIAFLEYAGNTATTYSSASASFAHERQEFSAANE